MIKYGWEDPVNNWGDFELMFKKHFKHIFGEERDVSPEYIQQLAGNGSLMFLTARYSGKAIGYYAVVTAPSLYAGDRAIAREIAIYVDEDYRNQQVASEMQNIMDQTLRHIGTDEIYVTYPYKSEIPIRAGYEFKEITYRRKL